MQGVIRSSEAGKESDDDESPVCPGPPSTGANRREAPLTEAPLQQTRKSDSNALARARRHVGALRARKRPRGTWLRKARDWGADPIIGLLLMVFAALGTALTLVLVVLAALHAG